MKASLPLVALLLATSIPAANAQKEPARTGSCPKCAANEQRILKLQSELATLKGETPAAPEIVAEPLPIVPETALASAPSASGKTYTVEPGDALMKIARKTGCKASDIAALNGMTVDSVIKIGQVLKLPDGAQTAAAPQNAAVAEEAPKPTQGPPSQPKTYTIQDGETYYSLSRRLGISVEDLIAANPKTKPTQLYTGRVINLPTKGEVPGPQEPDREPAAAPAQAKAAPPAQQPAAPPTAQQNAPAASEKKVIAVSVDEEISYGEFAAKYGTDTDRLNSLNDLNLTSATILAKGSELYVPAQATTAGN